jgi:hypothetical protein
MPRKKKHPIEMTTEEMMKKLFPKEVRDYVKDVAQNPDRYRKKSPHKWSLTGCY